MDSYLGIDVGTTTVAAIVLDTDSAQVIARHSIPNDSKLPGDEKLPGRSEWDIDCMVELSLQVISTVAAQIEVDAMAGLGVTGQMHGMVLLDADCQPVSPFIGWQDQRCEQEISEGKTYLQQMLELAGDGFDLSGCTHATGYMGSTLFWLRHNDLLPAGSVVAVAAIGIVLTMTPRVDVLAQAIAAMADVETAHMILTFEADVHPYDVGDSHMWYSRRHGYRSENLGGIHRRYTISVYTSEGTWLYSPEDHKVVIKEPDTETLQAPDRHRLFFGAPFFKLLSEKKIPYQQSDGTLDGVPMTRFDFEMLVNGKKTTNTVWIDKTTGLLAAIVDTDVETGQINGELRCEYNMPLDPALFTFEIPEGATVEDRRGAAEPQEGSQ